MRCLPVLAFGAGLALVVVSLGGCQRGIVRLDARGLPVLRLADLRQPGAADQLAAKLQAAPSGRDGPRGVIVHLRAGESLPLRVVMDIGVAELQAGANRLTFHRDAYLYIARGTFLLSPDGRRWAAPGHVRALRRLFGLPRGGTFQAGFGVTREAGPLFSVGLRVGRASR